MSMYFDARINNGNNGSNDDTMFGKDLKTSLGTRFIVDRLINDNPIVVIRVFVAVVCSKDKGKVWATNLIILCIANSFINHMILL